MRIQKTGTLRRDNSRSIGVHRLCMAFCADISLPSAVHGPVDFSHGFHCRIGCRTRCFAVHCRATHTPAHVNFLGILFDFVAMSSGNFSMT